MKQNQNEENDNKTEEGEKRLQIRVGRESAEKTRRKPLKREKRKIEITELRCVLCDWEL